MVFGTPLVLLFCMACIKFHQDGSERIGDGLGGFVVEATAA